MDEASTQALSNVMPSPPRHARRSPANAILLFLWHTYTTTTMGGDIDARRPEQVRPSSSSFARTKSQMNGRARVLIRTVSNSRLTSSRWRRGRGRSAAAAAANGSRDPLLQVLKSVPGSLILLCFCLTSDLILLRNSSSSNSFAPICGRARSSVRPSARRFGKLASPASTARRQQWRRRRRRG